ncbi:transforming growth factor beta activator LRRC32 isoform X1 [Bufo gargarizans]|uniref:transforming growth factor beta activator LRRC32 isoform X1 n=2 Tax=Bufo gargarizans TaxID=30331 RepID=UPI001CF43365|nr:transforming growth factor beta activator LRRC32 isoform X1 [Bufo gargarizans]
MSSLVISVSSRRKLFIQTIGRSCGHLLNRAMLLYLPLLLTMVNEGSLTYRAEEKPPCAISINMVANCQNKSFQEIPLGLPVKTNALYMSKNDLRNLTKIPLTLYSFIEILDLSSNKIRYIQPDTFEEMVNLKEINLSDNYLDRFVSYRSLGIGLLPNVQKLDLSRNSLYTDMITYFLENAPHLRYLSLSENSITMISPEMFSGTPSLEELDLHNNIIMDIEEGSFEHLLHLKKINLAMNSITCISQFNLRQLQSLILSKNSLQSFYTSESDEEYNLRYVDLSDNKLVRFPVFPDVNNIIFLNLSMNLIRYGEEASQKEYSWLEEDGGRNASMVNLQKLTHLDLSYNNIQSITEDVFITMPMLKFVNLSRNCLQSFQFGEVVKLNSLEELDLSENLMQNMSLGTSSLPSLQVLHLQNNQLQLVESRTFQNLPSITTINLQNNMVDLCGMNLEAARQKPGTHSCVFFYNIPTLQYLNLRQNMLETLPQYVFYGTSLTFLDISMNLGLTIKPNAMKGLESSLEVLHIEDNYLIQLNVDLPCLVQLRYLNLSGNQLTWLPSWNKNCRLETLDLSNNSFSNLKDSNIPILENTLKTLSLYGNPLSCCANSWVTHMVRRNMANFIDIDATMCQNSNGERVEILLGQNNSDNCEEEEMKDINLVIIITIVLVLLVTGVGVGLLVFYCKQKVNQQFKA